MAAKLTKKRRRRRLSVEGRYKKLFAAYLAADRRAIAAAKSMASLEDKLHVIERKVGYDQTAAWQTEYEQSIADRTKRKLEKEAIRREVLARSALLGGGSPFKMIDSKGRHRGWGFLHEDADGLAPPRADSYRPGDGYIFGRGWFANISFGPSLHSHDGMARMWRELSAAQKSDQHFRLGGGAIQAGRFNSGG